MKLHNSTKLRNFSHRNVFSRPLYSKTSYEFSYNHESLLKQLSAGEIYCVRSWNFLLVFMGDHYLSQSTQCGYVLYRELDSSWSFAAKCLLSIPDVFKKLDELQYTQNLLHTFPLDKTPLL